MKSLIDEAIENLRIADCGMPMYDAIIQSNDTIVIAKKILLSAKVQQFSASDVVGLARIIIERESELHARQSEIQCDEF